MRARVGLPAAGKAAMEKEIKRQLADFDRMNELEIDAMVLWVLHEEFGFGKKRLRKFFDRFSDSLDDLLKWYDMDTSDQSWICTYKLKQIGVDVEAWNKEHTKNTEVMNNDQ